MLRALLLACLCVAAPASAQDLLYPWSETYAPGTVLNNLPSGVCIRNFYAPVQPQRFPDAPQFPTDKWVADSDRLRSCLLNAVADLREAVGRHHPTAQSLDNPLATMSQWAWAMPISSHNRKSEARGYLPQLRNSTRQVRQTIEMYSWHPDVVYRAKLVHYWARRLNFCVDGDVGDLGGHD